MQNVRRVIGNANAVWCHERKKLVWKVT